MAPVAMFASIHPLQGQVEFVATLEQKDGTPVRNAMVSIALIGGGSLNTASGLRDSRVVFPETDEDGIARFSWICGDEPAEVIINASSRSGDSLQIRQVRGQREALAS